MLLARAFDPVLIITISERKLPDNLIETVGCIAIRVAAAKPDHLSGPEFVNHQLGLSRGRMQDRNPVVTAGVAPPMMVNESVAAVLGRRRRDRGGPVAGGAVTSGGMIAGRRQGAML